MARGIRTSPEKRAEIAKLRKQGMTRREIAEITGVSVHTIRQICEETEIVQDKRGRLGDLWKQWDELHRRYGTNA